MANQSINPNCCGHRISASEVEGEAKLEQLESAYRKDINKRPVSESTSQRNAMVTVRVDPPFLGSAVGKGGVYPIELKCVRFIWKKE